MVRTFNDLVKRFLKWAQKARKPATVAVYRHYFKQFASDNGDVDLSDITPACVTAWAHTWHQMQSLKRLFNWAVTEARILAVNPIAGVKNPPKALRRRIFTRYELVHMLRASKADCRQLLQGYRETMARPQELRLACWEDLAADDPTIPVRQALLAGRCSVVLYEFKNHASRKDTDAPRVILISPRAGRLLVRLWDRSRTKKGPIFLTKRGRPWTANALRCRFRRLRVKLEVNRDKRGETLVPYTFRHTGATIAAAKGVRDRILADILGHVEVKTTHRYIHLQTKHLQDALRPVWIKERTIRPRGDGGLSDTAGGV